MPRHRGGGGRQRGADRVGRPVGGGRSSAARAPLVHGGRGRGAGDEVPAGRRAPRRHGAEHARRPGATTSGLTRIAVGSPALDQRRHPGRAAAAGRAGAGVTRARGWPACQRAQRAGRRPRRGGRSGRCGGRPRPCPGAVLTSTMPTPSAGATAVGLVDPADAAALAEHDRAGGAGGVEGARAADPGLAPRWRRRRRRRRRARAGPARRARAEAIAPVERAARRRAATRPRRWSAGDAADGGDPRATAWAAYARAAVVAGGGDHDDVPPRRRRAGRARRCRCSAGPPTERLSTSTPSRGGAVDRGDQVGGRAAVVGGVGGGPAGLVDGDPGLRGRRRRRGRAAGRGTCDRDAGVAGRDRGHLGAVAAVVARRERRGGCARCRRRSRRRTTARRPACRCRRRRPSPRPASQAPRKPRGLAAQARDRGEQRALGPDAGVDDADDDAGAAARGRRVPAPAPARRGARRRARRTAFSSTSATPRVAAEPLGLVGVSATAKPLSAVVHR